MTDITITDNRTTAQSELEQARAAEAEALALVAQKEAEITRLKTEPIAADDPRIVPLWNKVRRISVGAGYASYYDTLAEEMGGVLRERSFTLTYRATVEVNVPVQVNATSEDAADQEARSLITPQQVATALTGAGWLDLKLDDDYRVIED